jgi:radical SAM protein with 4Fe4S-binding SPASM domain
VDGNINICEKMSNTAPNIGNVFNGFDFDSIRHIIWKYNEEIIQNKCWECECWFLCNICFAKAFRDGEVKFDCSIRDYYLELLKGFLEQKEKEDEKGNGSDYNNIPDFLDSL